MHYQLVKGTVPEHKKMSNEEVEKHITRKFEICNRLGKGAYGVVFKATEKRSRAVIALKVKHYYMIFLLTLC